MNLPPDLGTSVLDQVLVMCQACRETSTADTSGISYSDMPPTITDGKHISSLELDRSVLFLMRKTCGHTSPGMENTSPPSPLGIMARSRY